MNQRLFCFLFLSLVSILFINCEDENSVLGNSLNIEKGIYNELELVLLLGENISFKSTTYNGTIDGSSVELLVVDENIVFLMPEIGAGNYVLNTTIDNESYSFNFQVVSDPVINNVAEYITTFEEEYLLDVPAVVEIQTNIEGMTNPFEEAANYSILEEYYTKYTTLFNDLSDSEKALIAKFIKANEDLFNYDLSITPHIDDFNAGRFGSSTLARLESSIQSITLSKVKLVGLVALTAYTINSCAGVPTPWTCGAAALSSAALVGKLYHHNSVIKAHVDKVFTPISVELDEISLRRSVDILPDELYTLDISLERRTFYNNDLNSENTKVQTLIEQLNESETTWDKIMSFIPTRLSGDAEHIKNKTSYKSKPITEGTDYLEIKNITNSNVTLVSSNIVDQKLTVEFTSESTTNLDFGFDIVYDDGEFQITETVTATLQLENNNVFIDPRDGEIYPIVTFGGQTWMAENMRYAVSGSVTGSSDDYGRYYNREQSRDACPSGWSLPLSDQCVAMESFLGVEAGTKLKSTSGWFENGNGDNEVGFNAFPAGSYQDDVGFNAAGEKAYFWMNFYDDAVYYMSYNDYALDHIYVNSGFYLPCRCIKL